VTGFVTNQYGKLRKVLLCEPRYYRLMPSNETAKAYLNRGQPLDMDLVHQEHQDLATVLTQVGAQVVWLEPQQHMPYQVFTRDLGVVTASGALLGQFTYAFRQAEVEAAIPVIEEAVPIWKRLPDRDDLRFEGGDFMYLDNHWAAVGVGARTTPGGARLVEEYMAEVGVEVTPLPIDHRYCHIDMIFNVVAERVCIACLELLPEKFVARLKTRGWQIVETTPEDVLRLLGNLLTLDCGLVLSPGHNARINGALRALGIDVVEIGMEETLKGGGGLHCLTFPLERDPA
jgi:N-dimethylarginine dimethylaminohydrolase